MQFTSQTSSDGVTEQFFVVPAAGEDVPAVLWTPQDAAGNRRLILMGHGGGQHKSAPGVVARARQFVEHGYAVVAVDAPGHGERMRTEEQSRLAGEIRSRMQAGLDALPVLAEFHSLLVDQGVTEWRAVVDAVAELGVVEPGRVGYWGLSLGCALGVRYVADDPRVVAAVLGLNGVSTSAGGAQQVSVPVEFLVQWDDELVPRSDALALFDAFASAEKTLHANRGGHFQVPDFETESSLRFFGRHLT